MPRFSPRRTGGVLAPASLAVFLALHLACDGGSMAPTTPTPPPPPAATVEPSPTPTATPTAAPTDPPPRRNAPGPVDHVALKVHAIRMPDGNYRRPYDEDGDWIVNVGEVVAIDATPKNALAQACDYDGEPEWTVDEYALGFRRLPSPNPFVYWAEAQGAGYIEFRATVDGKGSNIIRLAIR